MPSHYSTIGFGTPSPDDFLELARQASLGAQRIPVSGGRYLKWSPQTGEQLWMQVDGNDDLRGISPHFAGESEVRVVLERRVMRKGSSPFEGAFLARARDTGGPYEADSTGDYPFVFDCPDIALHSSVALPAEGMAQIAAFAHELSLFPSEEAYSTYQQSQEARFATLLHPIGHVSSWRRASPSSQLRGHILWPHTQGGTTPQHSDRPTVLVDAGRRFRWHLRRCCTPRTGA
jgi:hypothetical protein